MVTAKSDGRGCESSPSRSTAALQEAHRRFLILGLRAGPDAMVRCRPHVPTAFSTLPARCPLPSSTAWNLQQGIVPNSNDSEETGMAAKVETMTDRAAS